ncbi:hypothetical protein PV08_10338 [Exophiala spinifera]|uniref:Conserved oligomeric Golgi complex subunit 6 n=1 Tax=Exophiala spinifera TaxID=91928 RepID=A0A0D2BI75_9EURO|nr:uncharacterized protein PV08_10338 [Exophiala spinifera]KIW11039.1 hypothetical protein PV08_10338 [Exophiala spinifera]
MTTPYLSGLDGFASSNLESPIDSHGETVSSRRNNALSTKLTSVLSTSYVDHEIRDALRLLDVRGVHNDEETRRNLKLNAQREVIDCNAKIVDDFGQIAEQLRRVGSLLSTLDATCSSMRQHIIAAKQESAPVLEEARTLISRKQETETRQVLLDAFNAHFLLSPADAKILTSSAEPLDDRFFTALTRAKTIYRDCEVLLGYDGENQRLGLELMEQTTRTLDAGFKKLYNWIQLEFKTLDLEDPHISTAIRRALTVLSERPTLFHNCLDFFAEARQSTLAEAFQAALTGTGPAAHRKAIEFLTHEPLRYVGDMLAWVHSAAVSENEALEGLFIADADEISRGLASKAGSEPWARIDRGARNTSNDDDDDDDDDDEQLESVFDPRKALADLVSRNLAVVCETLQSRIDLSVSSTGDPVLTYKTFNLLDFYRGIFDKLLGSESALCKAIRNLQSSALSQFEAIMAEETAAAIATEIEPSSDLSPPAYLATVLRQFSEVARARGPQLTESELERLFNCMLMGILTACADSAAQMPDARESNIYRINYVTALKATMATVSAQAPVAQAPLERAGLEIRSLRDELVKALTTLLLDDSGVRDLLQELDTRRSQDARTRRAWLVTNLDGAAQRLDDFLSSALMDAQDGMKNLLDRTLAKDVVSEAVEKFCAEFDELEGILDMVDVETGGADGEGSAGHASDQVASLRQLYPRTGAEVRALLS